MGPHTSSDLHHVMTILLMILFSDSLRCLDDGNTEPPDVTATESQNARDFVILVQSKQHKHILPSRLVVLLMTRSLYELTFQVIQFEGLCDVVIT